MKCLLTHKKFKIVSYSRVRFISCVCTILFGFAFSSHAYSTEITVTQSNLDQGNYSFAISNSLVSTGTVFNIEIRTKLLAFPPNSEVNLFKISRNHSVIISPLTNSVKIELTKTANVWKIKLFAPPTLLEDPAIFLIFEVNPYPRSSLGKYQLLAADRFYEISLHNFSKY